MFTRINANANTNKKDPLVQSYHDGDYEGFKKLINMGANVNCMISEKSKYYPNCLLISAVIANTPNHPNRKNKLFFDALMESDVHIGQCGFDDTILKNAIENNSDIYFMKKILEKGVDINSYGERTTEQDWDINISDPAIFTAFNSESDEKIKLLLSYKPDLTKKSNCGTPLLIYLLENNSSLLKKYLPVLIKQGADIHQQHSKYKFTFLHTLSNHSYDEEFFDIALNNNADLEAKDKLGNTPMMSCALFGIPKTMEIFLKKGAKLNVKNKDGITLAMNAIGNKRGYGLDLLEILKEAGENFSMTDNGDNNVLHHMAYKEISFKTKTLEYSATKHLKFIMENKDLLSRRNNKNETPIEVFEARHPNLYSMIMEKMAKEYIKTL